MHLLWNSLPMQKYMHVSLLQCSSATPCYNLALFYGVRVLHFSLLSPRTESATLAEEEWDRRPWNVLKVQFCLFGFSGIAHSSLHIVILLKCTLCTLLYCHIAKVRERDISARVRLYQLHHDVESSTTFPPLSLHYLSLLFNALRLYQQYFTILFSSTKFALSLSPLMLCLCINNISLFFFPPQSLHYLSLL